MEENKSSRLIVKNLPKHMDDKRFKETFEKFGPSTDAKIARRNGRSRLFGFIGFKSILTAENVKNYFDNSFLDTSKISVSYAMDPTKCPRAWSRYTKNKNLKRNRTDQNDQKVREKTRKDSNKDEKGVDFEVFLRVSKGRPFEPFENENEKVNKEKYTLKQDSDNEKAESDDFSESERKRIFGDCRTSKVQQKLRANLTDSSAAAEEDPTERLMVLNIPYNSVEEEVRNFFSQFGDVIEVHIPKDELKRSKGFCFVRFAEKVQAENLLKKGERIIFQGRLVKLVKALEDERKIENSAKPASFKDKRERERQRNVGSEAGKDYWKTLFLRADTVVAAVSEKLGKKKSEVLTDSDRKQSMAVKMALSEAHVIEETKEYFKNHGVNPDIFKTGFMLEKKSNTVFFVKNLPFSTLKSELEKVFDIGAKTSKFAYAKPKIFVPPSKSVALVVFKDPMCSNFAYRNLAYKKFKNVPLYLEWAPSSIFSKPNLGDSGNENGSEKRVLIKGNMKNGSERVFSVRTEAALLDEPSETVFIKNLNFETTESALRKLFSVVGGLVHLTIKTKTTNEKQKLSLGFGFAQFESIKSAQKAIKTLQGATLDGHCLQLQFSHTKLVKSGISGAVLRNRKIVVKNLPFEATKKEVRSLFSEYGSVTSCRVPTRLSRHRGFAFVEMATAVEAGNAFEKLAETHLYGRHLVLEWAKPEGEDVRK